MQIENYNNSFAGGFFMNITRNIRFFIFAALCLNSLNALANEYRPRHSVPQHNKAHSTGFFIFSPLIVFAKFTDGLSHIHMPNFGRLLEHIDFSCVTETVQKDKVISWMGVGASIIFLSVLVKQLQKSELLQEKYLAAEKSIDDYTKSCLEQCPMPVRLAITPIKILLQFLCNAIKKYVAMNSKTLVLSVVAPVSGRVLDGVCVCPIPLLNFTSIGGMASGCILTKGYFDSSFEKVDERFDGIETKIEQSNQNNIQQHTATQEKIGVVQQTINGVSERVSKLYNKIKGLDTGVSQIREQVSSVSEQVKNVFQELTGIKKEVALLHDKFDLKDKKDIQQYENVQKRLESVELLLQKKIEHNEALMRELQGLKSTYESNHEDLRKDLGATSAHLSRQINDVKKEVQEGFASQNRQLVSPDHKDVKIAVLQLQAGQRITNNS